MSSDVSHSDGDTPYKTYSKRWFILAMFSSLSLSNAMLWVTFAPISDIASNYFGGDNTTFGSTTAINMLANVFLILYAAGTILGVILMKSYNLRTTLLVAGSLSVFGAALRYIASSLSADLGNGGTYWLVMTGQCIASLSQPILINMTPVVASIWFPVSERDVSTTIGSMFNPIGNAVGQVLPVIFVTQTGPESGPYQVHGMSDLMLVEVIICVVPLVAALLFLRDSPPTPPSYSTKVKSDKISRQKRANQERRLREEREQQERQEQCKRSANVVFRQSATANSRPGSFCSVTSMNTPVASVDKTAAGATGGIVVVGGGGGLPPSTPVVKKMSAASSGSGGVGKMDSSINTVIQRNDRIVQLHQNNNRNDNINISNSMNNNDDNGIYKGDGSDFAVSAVMNSSEAPFVDQFADTASVTSSTAQSERDRLHSIELGGSLPEGPDIEQNNNYNYYHQSQDIGAPGGGGGGEGEGGDTWEALRTFFAEVTELFSQRDYVILFTVFSIGVGFFNSMMTLLNQIVQPHGYSNDDAGTFGALVVVMGLVGAGCIGYVMEKTRAYKTILKSLFVLAVLLGLLTFSMLYHDNLWPLTASFGLLGFCILPILPVLIENCAECTYPIPEDLSLGIMFVGSNVLGIGFIFGVQLLLEMPALGPPPFLPSSMFMIGMTLIALVCLFFYKGEYKRLAMESRSAPSSSLLLHHAHIPNGFGGRERAGEREGMGDGGAGEKNSIFGGFGSSADDEEDYGGVEEEEGKSAGKIHNEENPLHGRSHRRYPDAASETVAGREAEREEGNIVESGAGEKSGGMMSYFFGSRGGMGEKLTPSRRGRGREVVAGAGRIESGQHQHRHLGADREVEWDERNRSTSSAGSSPGVGADVDAGVGGSRCAGAAKSTGSNSSQDLFLVQVGSRSHTQSLDDKTGGGSTQLSGAHRGSSLWNNSTLRVSFGGQSNGTASLPPAAGDNYYTNHSGNDGDGSNGSGRCGGGGVGGDSSFENNQDSSSMAFIDANEASIRKTVNIIGPASTTTMPKSPNFYVPPTALSTGGGDTLSTGKNVYTQRGKGVKGGGNVGDVGKGQYSYSQQQQQQQQQQGDAEVLNPMGDSGSGLAEVDALVNAVAESRLQKRRQ